MGLIVVMKSSDGRGLQLGDLQMLLAVLRDGTLTRAAHSLGVTQSALSYQLEGMRRRFADPLFVRVGNRMEATPFAQRLAEPAARVLRIVDTEIAGLARFDPATTDREFRIGLNEIGAITLLPVLVAQLAATAPRARLAPVHVDPDTVATRLESGQVDLIAGHFPGAHDGLLQQLLYRRDYVCVARRDHPHIGDRLSLQQFARTPQIDSPASPVTRAFITSTLREAGLRPAVQMSTQQVAAIPFIVAASDRVAVIPREVFELFSPIAPIKRVRLPFEIPPIEIHQYWHARVASDPAVRFIREQVFAAAQSRSAAVARRRVRT